MNVEMNPRATLESLTCRTHFPGFEGDSNNLVTQIRIAAKRDNMLIRFHHWTNQMKSFPEIFVESTFQISLR